MKKWLLLLVFLPLIPSLGFPGWVTQTSGTDRNLRDVWYLYDPFYRGWAVGDSGTILTTTNFGTSWAPQSSPTSLTLYGIAHDPVRGFFREWATAVGGDSSGVILHTTNGGNVWSVRATPPSAMYAVSYGDSLHGWAAGGAGSIWRTTDGGFTWTFQAAPLRVTWYGIWFEDAQRGWVCGTNGAIMATTDGGATWGSQASGTSDTLRGASFYVRGVVVGDSGKILRTANGGSTWSPVPSGVSEDLYSVYMRGYDAYAVGANGRILKGSGDGSTWAPDTSITSKHLRGIHYILSADWAIHVWAVGDSGEILYKFILSVGAEEESSNGWGKLSAGGEPRTAHPNPFTSFTTLPGHEADRFTLYDISGRRVGVYKGDRIGEGLRAGVYFVRAEGGGAKPVRVVKVR